MDKISNLKESLRKTILESEHIIQESLEILKKKKLHEKINQFDIEVFVYPFYDISAVLFSMSDDFNGVEDDNKEFFSGSLDLIENLDIEHLNIKDLDDKETKEFYDVIIYTLKEIVARNTEDIKLPIFLMFHDTGNKLNVKTNDWKNIYADYNTKLNNSK